MLFLSSVCPNISHEIISISLQSLSNLCSLIYTNNKHRNMKNFSFGVGGLMLVLIFLMVCLFAESLRVPPHHHASIHGKATKFGDEGQVHPEEGVKEVVGMELYPTGSSLPDCSHACGPCFPCKRVMVSFKCSIAESCPIVYRCMCKGKYYHVPSN